MLRWLWRHLTGGCTVSLHRLVLLAERKRLDGVRSLWWCRWCDRVWLIRDSGDLPPSCTFEIETGEQASGREAANAKIAPPSIFQPAGRSQA